MAGVICNGEEDNGVWGLGNMLSKIKKLKKKKEKKKKKGGKGGGRRPLIPQGNVTTMLGSQLTATGECGHFCPCRLHYRGATHAVIQCIKARVISRTDN